MTDATSQPPALPELIQARRLELLDDDGNARIVLGDLARYSDDGYWPGLVIRSPEGRDRVRLMLHSTGVDLEFERNGNIVAVLGVLDPAGESPDPGVRLVMCDPGSTPVVGWRVYDDGTWERVGSR